MKFQKEVFMMKKLVSMVLVCTLCSFAAPAVSLAADYVGNARSMKFHYADCRWAKKISAANRVEFESREEAVEEGYVPCQVCNP